MFGDALSADALPMVNELLDFIEERGLQTEGVFRLSASATHIETLKKLYNNSAGAAIDLETVCNDPIAAASLFKFYLRELPDSILPARVYDFLLTIEQTPAEAVRIKMYRTVLGCIPDVNWIVLDKLFRLLVLVNDNAESNKMHYQNLATLFGPTMMRRDTDNPMLMMLETPGLVRVAKDMFTHHQALMANHPLEYMAITRAEYDYPGGENDVEVPFKEDTVIFLVEAQDDSDGWLEGTIAGPTSCSGLFPGNYVAVYERAENRFHVADTPGDAGESAEGGAVEQRLLDDIDQMRDALAREQQLREDMDDLVKVLSQNYEALVQKMLALETTNQQLEKEVMRLVAQ